MAAGIKGAFAVTTFVLKNTGTKLKYSVDACSTRCYA